MKLKEGETSDERQHRSTDRACATGTGAALAIRKEKIMAEANFL